MPTYEYKCDKCGLEFEEYQSITAAALTKCKKADCNGTVQRLFSAGGGFLFKGSGFYITDHRSDSYKKAAKSDSPGVSSTTPASDSSKKPGVAAPPASDSSKKPESKASAAPSSPGPKK